MKHIFTNTKDFINFIPTVFGSKVSELFLNYEEKTRKFLPVYNSHGINLTHFLKEALSSADPRDIIKVHVFKKSWTVLFFDNSLQHYRVLKIQ